MTTDETHSKRKEFEDFVKLAKEDKAGRRLHTVVEERLALFLSRLYPEDCTASEVSGILGGRNDLMKFSFNGRHVVFELFFSPSQVPQDLRLLEQSKADIKIAILLDQEINPKLADEYFHKKPDPFPYLWLSDIMMHSQETICLARLRELIDEDAAVNSLRRILSSPVGPRFEEPLRKQLKRIEAKLAGEENTTKKLHELTGEQFIVLQIILKIRKMGVPIERLRSLDVWLQENIGFAFTLVVAGLQAFLTTDLDGHHEIWATGDFADSVILGAEENDRVRLVICLNKIINDLLEANGYERRALRYHFFHTYEEHIGKIIPIWDLETTTTEYEEIS